jgi:hypothetical protein
MDGFRHHFGGILFGLGLAVITTISPAAAKDVVLSQDNITRFLATFPEIRDLAVSEGLRTGTDSEAAKNPLGAVLKAIKSSKLKTDAEKIAVAHGFNDLKDWAGTGSSIAQAYVFITVGPARGIARDTLEKNKDAAIGELEKLGILTGSNKQKLKESLDSVTDALAKEPPPGNVAIVKQMQPEIEAAVKFGGD